METPVRVILADDHDILRQGLKLIIQSAPSIEVVGEAADGPEAIALTLKLLPDVLVCDIAMPTFSGIEVARQLAAHKVRTRILFLTMQDKEEYLIEAMRAGVKGFLPKKTVGDELIEAIGRVSAGGEYYSRLVHEKAFTALRKLYEVPDIRLTPREREILKLLAAGLNSRMIAHQLSLSEYTVTNHRTNLLRKFNAGNVAELIRKATGLSMI
jgi:DNA-binding NarL/FixJ family response regulator